MNRRELLGGLGIASASTLLATFGCGAKQQQQATRAKVVSIEARTWLREAVERLAAHFPAVHVLAVMRRRSTAAIDVLGIGGLQERRDGAVLTVRERGGIVREEVTSDLTAAGLTAATRRLIGASKKLATLRFPAPLRSDASTPGRIDDPELRTRVEELATLDKPESRIVYAAALVELDDATVWSIAPDHDREQRLVRIRERVVRAAWNGPRAMVGEASGAWLGTFADRGLDRAAIDRANAHALELMTPGRFEEWRGAVLLDPSVTATLVDAAVRALLTASAARRPEQRRRVVIGAPVAAPLVTLVDDPTAARAYGGFQFDDAGVPAQKQMLLDGGKVAGILGAGRTRRAGHVGLAESAPSHLVVAHGAAPHGSLLDSGLLLEGGTTATVDASSTRVVIGAARAREIKGGDRTGRVYPDVELVGELAAVLASVSAISSDSRTFGLRGERDGEPSWSSVDAPWLRVEGTVRTRRQT